MPCSSPNASSLVFQPVRQPALPEASWSATASGGDTGRGCSWVVPLRISGTRPPLFCAVAGYGDVFDYRDLALALPEDQPVYSFGLPGLSDGQLFPTVEQIASVYVRKIRAIQPNGPYHLCGYSFGGLVVYEMAARLAEEQEDVAMLVMLDTEHDEHGD